MTFCIVNYLYQNKNYYVQEKDKSTE